MSLFPGLDHGRRLIPIHLDADTASIATEEPEPTSVRYWALLKAGKLLGLSDPSKARRLQQQGMGSRGTRNKRKLCEKITVLIRVNGSLVKEADRSFERREKRESRLRSMEKVHRDGIRSEYVW